MSLLSLTFFFISTHDLAGSSSIEPNGTAAKYNEKSIGSKPKRKIGASNAEDEIAMNISEILLWTS